MDQKNLTESISLADLIAGKMLRVSGWGYSRASLALWQQLKNTEMKAFGFFECSVRSRKPRIAARLDTPVCSITILSLDASIYVIKDIQRDYNIGKVIIRPFRTLKTSWQIELSDVNSQFDASINVPRFTVGTRGSSTEIDFSNSSLRFNLSSYNDYQFIGGSYSQLAWLPTLGHLNNVFVDRFIEDNIHMKPRLAFSNQPVMNSTSMFPASIDEFVPENLSLVLLLGCLIAVGLSPA